MRKLEEWIRTGEAPSLPLYVSPFAKSSSGSSRDDDEDDDGDDDEDDDEDDDDPDEDKSDEELRAELKATRETLERASGSVSSKRKRIQRLTRELEEARSKPKPKKPASSDDDAPDLDELRETARREGESAGLTRAKKAEAKAELLAAGVSRDKIAIALRNVDLDEMDLDDEGLDGIDDAIAELKTALPALFARKRTRRESVAGNGDRDGKDASARRKPKTASELAAAKVLGR